MFKGLKSVIKNNTNPKKQNATVGEWAEDLASQYLQAQGLKLIQRHYRTKLGEIDLVMQDKDEVVFTEVRYRKNAHYVSPEETVSYHKQQRLIKAAYHFQQYHEWADAFSFRFDVIGISGGKLNFKIAWIQNAFGVE